MCLINDFSLIANLLKLVYGRAECATISLEFTKVKLLILNNFVFYRANLDLSIQSQLKLQLDFYCSNIKFINNASNTYISGICHIDYAVEQGKLFSVMWRIRTYFKIDQHLAWHFVYYVECHLPFYAVK